MRQRAAVVAVLLAFGAGATALAQTARAPEIGTFGHGSWSWFADPRAVHVTAPRDETFVGWISWSGAIVIGDYDTASGTFRAAAVGHLFHDDHGNPALLVEPDGRLTVFWSAHDGPRMSYRTTTLPEDITSWGPVRTIHANLGGGRGFTYPNPVLLATEGNEVYLFWRGTDWSTDYETRSTSGQWGPAHRLIAMPGERPYLKVDSYGGDAISLAFTNGHPRERLTSIYYAAIKGGLLRHASGRPIAPLSRAPIHPSAGDLVYDATKRHISGWVWDVAVDQQQHPVIAYATFPSANNHQYWYARWDGRRWVSHFITSGGPTIAPGTIETEYSGGLTLDHNDPATVYLSRKVGRWFEIEKWVTGDGGYHWTHSTVVRTPGADDIRPVVPRGPLGPVKLLWLHGHYGDYTSYRTSIAYLR
jgi:BNR repeat-containing family member